MHICFTLNRYVVSYKYRYDSLAFELYIDGNSFVKKRKPGFILK